MNFEYNLPVNIIFGNGTFNKLGSFAKEYGHCALIVAGHSAVKNGLVDKAASMLNDKGIDSVLFDRVGENPLTSTALEGVKTAKAYSCDMVLAIGGGSIMDCAKSIAFLCLNEGDPSDYIFLRKIGKGALPLILVPTTCGTGSEGNGFAVLTDPYTHDKKALRRKEIIASVSIIDPELMRTMPKSVLASVGFDALCHNMEAYCSILCNPLVKIQAGYAIGLTAKSLIKTYNGSADSEDWENLTLASTIGGMVIGAVGVTAPHGMEHPVSGLKNVVHGKGLAAIAPEVYSRSVNVVPDVFSEISCILGGHDEKDMVPILCDLIDSVELNCTLSQLGIAAKDIPWLTQNCGKVSDMSIKAHPVIFSEYDISDIYCACL